MREEVSFDDEMLIVVDSDDNVIDYKDKVTCHVGDGILHRAFSIFIFNDAGELLIQKRSEQKPLWGLIWANSCCSHPRKGETVANAADRRLTEELGISTPLTSLYTFEYKAAYKKIGTEHEMCTVLIGKSNAQVNAHPSEVAEFKYVPIDEVSKAIATEPEIYSPWFKMEWERLAQDFMTEIKAVLNSK